MPNPKLETYKNKATGDVYDYTDADAQGKLTAILDGTTIDSFSDVESALGGKVDVVTGKGLSTNDYDNTAKAIVDTAQDNINANTKLIKDTVGWSGKNKFKIRDNFTGETKNGVVFTIDSKRIITANNQATAVATIDLGKVTLPAGKYIASGCPSGGDSNSYRVNVSKWVNNQEQGIGFDYGDGLEFTLAEETVVYMYPRIASGYTASNLKFKLMMRPADILDSTYEPYFGSTAFPRSEQAVLGAKNLLDNRASTTENNGVTFTVNSDGSITANGNATALARVALWNNIGSFLKAGERYTISTGLPSDSPTDYFLNFVQKHDNTDLSNIAIYGTEKTVTIDSQCNNLYIAVIVSNGKTVNNVTFKPMIRLATDTDPTFAPYAMTNEQLTDAVTLKNGLSSVTVIEGATLSANDSFLRKQNNVISAQLRVNGVTANSGANIATIPSGYIPSLTGGTVVFMSNASTGEMIPAYITINGYVCARTNLSSVDVNINFTYIAP